jgi:single-stranded-DNA-specific exonuclease
MLGGAESVLDPKELLDCFAIGTITDLVPLQFEIRILVKHGLVILAETKRPGLQELLKALDLWGRPLTAQDVAIKFAPKLNALSRMGSGIQPLDLYLEADVEKARELVSRVLSNNQDRQASQKMADEEADRLLAERPPQGAIVIASEKFHRGVVGLVATKQSQRHGLPAFVASIEGEAGSVVGSARVPQGMSLSLLDALTSASNYLDQFGGHAVAAGFEARLATFEDFRRTLERWFLEHAGESGADGTLTTLKYDASCSLADLNAGFMAWHDHMGPFGAHAPVPVFRFDHCLVSQVRVLKGGHLRLKLVQSGAQAVQAIWFSPPEGAEPRQGEYVSVLAEVQWNHFQGMRTIQLLVTDLLAEPRA